MADSTVIPGHRPSLDFPDGLGGVNVPDDGSGGLVESEAFGYPEPTVPVFLSPGNQRKLDLDSPRN